MFGFSRKLRTPQAIARRRRLRIVIVALAFMALGVMGWGIVELLRSPFIRIAHIEVVGAQTISAAALQEKTRDMLSGMFLGVIPSDNTLVLSTKKLEQQLAELFPRIEHVEITRAGASKLALHLTEREPHALWCGDVAPPTSDIMQGIAPRCYFLDKTGFLFAPAPAYRGVSFHRFFGAITKSVVVGQHFLPSHEYETLHAFLEEVARENIPIYGLLVLDEHDIELYLTNGLRLLVRRHDRHERVLSRLLTVFAMPSFTRLDDIEYIDLRFGNKIYYRPRHHVAPTVVPNPTPAPQPPPADIVEVEPSPAEEELEFADDTEE